MSEKAKKIVLTEDQSEALSRIKRFVTDDETRVFILTGYAGTGKTTLMKEVVTWLKVSKEPFHLLASTGRAAKVLSDKVDLRRSEYIDPGEESILADVTRRVTAETVHGHIYHFDGFNRDIDRMLAKSNDGDDLDKGEELLLSFVSVDPDAAHKALYIIDEASMVSDVEQRNPTQATFGTGCLLTDLLASNPLGKFLFVGDAYQLPPVGQPDSPALSASYISDHFDLVTEEYSLTKIVRQAEDNDIVLAADGIRKLADKPPVEGWGKLPLSNFRDIDLLGSEESFLSGYIRDIRHRNYSAATLICQSNKKCGYYSNLIRPELGFTDKTLQKGELLLVTQNNNTSGLRNGDLVEVISVGNREHRADLTFLRVEVKELSSNRVYSLFLIEEILYSGVANLERNAQTRLFIDFHLRMKKKGVRQNSTQYRIMMYRDEYLNALRAVFGYAITCHKAQGGEWPHVYVSPARNITLNAGRDAYQWLYTAMTRASERLFFVRDFFIE